MTPPFDQQARRQGDAERLDAKDEGTIAILLVDDDEDDFLLTRDTLHEADRLNFTMDWCSDYEPALEAIKDRRHDIYLIDYRLGERTGLELIREAFEHRPLAPVIMLTGQPAYSINIEAAALGVTDFLVKQELTPEKLERSVRYAISHQRAERYALAASAANDGIWDWDLANDSMYLSPRWHAILGHPAQASSDPPSAWFDLVSPEDLPALQAAVRMHLDGHTDHLEHEHRMRHSDGSWRWMLTRGLATRGADGQPVRLAGALSDMNDRRMAELRLTHAAMHDRLTGLPNRTLFMNRVEQSLKRLSREPSAQSAVLFIDLDGFKRVNDDLGHAGGDELLVMAADRITDTVRPTDTVARLGGDEFTVLLEDAQNARAVLVGDRIIAALEQPLIIANHVIEITASVGIGLSTPQILPADLVRNADIAMYEAKRSGRGRRALYDDGMHRRIAQRLRRQAEVRRLIEQRQIETYFQPVVELGSGQISHLEALVRWPYDDCPTTPAEFVAVAEEAGLGDALGREVLRAALRMFAHLHQQGLAPAEGGISVNFTRRQLASPSLREDIRTALADAAVNPQALSLEVAEGMLAATGARDSLEAVEALGVGVHVDRFGAESSSLPALRRHRVKALKLDLALSVDVLEDPGAQEVVRMVVALAGSLGVPVVAQGVESVEQLRFMRELGCACGQGQLIAPPQSAPATEEILRQWHAGLASPLPEERL